MVDLLKAIMDKYDGDTDLKAALSGGLYHLEAKQGTAFPYGVFYIVSDVPNWTFTSNMEEVVIHFNLFSKAKSVTEIGDLFTKLKTCFDWCTLDISNYHSIYMKRELSEPLPKMGKVWQYAISYRGLFEEI